MKRAAGVLAGTTEAPGGVRRWVSTFLAFATALCAVLGLVTATRGPATLNGAFIGGGGSGADAPRAAQIAITPTAGTVISPITPIAVSTDAGRIQSVAVTNSATGAAVGGKLATDGASWQTVDRLAYASSYNVVATATGSDGAVTRKTATVATLKPTSQAYPSFVPVPTAQSVGVGQPIVVRFDRGVTDRAAAEAALSVTSVPSQPGSWYWMSPTEVHYRPPTYWMPGTTITLTAALLGVDLGKGVYGAADRTETIHVHDSIVARADGHTEQMQIFDNGALVNTMAISLGSPGYPSHTGPHVISDKQPSVIMDSCTYGVCAGQPGYYREKVDLDERISNDGEFVHAAPWSVGQQGSRNVSHGCVNLSPANAQWFFNFFGVGDVVEIANSGGQPLPVWDTYGDWELSWSQWRAGSALHP